MFGLYGHTIANPAIESNQIIQFGVSNQKSIGPIQLIHRIIYISHLFAFELNFRNLNSYLAVFAIQPYTLYTYSKGTSYSQNFDYTTQTHVYMNEYTIIITVFRLY